MATFVLVHGSCHGVWCWKKVIPLLHKHGHDVYTPTLTGLGERSHLATRGTGLDTHVVDIIQVLEYEDLNEIILVGHSYGGLVIGGVAEKLPERIRRLVYLDAYIPQGNKSAFDIVPGLETIYKQRALKEQGREWLVASYTPEEFGATDSIDIEWMNSRLCPMPWHTHDQPLRIINPEAKKLPKSYISCTEFGYSQLRVQKSSADGDYHELKTGHDAMITVPCKLVQALEALV